MKLIIQYLLSLLLLGLSMSAVVGQDLVNLDSVERALNTALEQKSTFERMKLKRIYVLKESLNKTNTTASRYEIHQQLYLEFKTYQIDSALLYVQHNLQLAKELKDHYKQAQSQIQMAGLLSSAGRFIESRDLLKNLKREQLVGNLLADYYETSTNFYSQYGQSTNYNQYFIQSEIYRDSLLSVLPKNSLTYRINHATQYLFSAEVDFAEVELKKLLQEIKEPQHERAVITYLLGLIYKNKGHKDKQVYYFSLSAITDLKNSVRDNASLQSLALIYFERDNIDKAYQFIQQAMQDALFCNVRFRTIENSSFYPIINSAFQEKELASKNQLRYFLYTISVMSVLLLFVLIVVYMQMKRLKHIRKDLKIANEELHQLNNQLLDVNDDLRESNHIKEEYMAQFFEICSSYIDKLDHNRKGILKKLSNKQFEELSRELKSQDIINTELEDLYHNFDVIFLNLYPSFINDFNKLLKPEEQITLKPDELLNNELRIFALIRLGISDSNKIARFLRYSLRTVYNYRVKVKNKVIGSKEDFDERIKEIGNIAISS